MTLLGLSEKGQTFQYVLLTTKVVQVLQKYETEKQLNETEKQILGRAAALIKRIIEGAILVEGKEFDQLAPTQEGLSAYGYALSTIESLNLFNQIKGFTEFFKHLLDQLEIVEYSKNEASDISLLKNFFLALGSAFRGDLLKERYTEQPVLRKNTFHATSFA
ncbi:MAG: hypothetical protein HZA14_11420 [Nitrospirae bacterium]|nr:hypothetical protein [Nitrospirota bacterium]